MDCCDTKKENEKKAKGFWSGLFYGLIPHTGCILFIIASIFGVTVLMQFFKPLLMNRYFFHYLILISIGFASFSSFLYLRKHQHLSWHGIKKKKGYLLTMYGTTVGINLILFFLIFPFLTNFTGAAIVDPSGFAVMKISVDIPCPGHAPLITSELETIKGVEGSEYSFPNDFEVYYDLSKTSEKEILSLEVFEAYPAEVLESSSTPILVESQPPTTPVIESGSCSGGCGASGTCGGCGSSGCSK